MVFIFRGFSPYPLPSDSCIKSSQSNSRAGFGRSLVHHAVGHYYGDLSTGRAARGGALYETAFPTFNEPFIRPSPSSDSRVLTD